jgi:hypothetical protein
MSGALVSTSFVSENVMNDVERVCVFFKLFYHVLFLEC